MVRFETGDILTADVTALVNPVNCVGAMGRGLALQFKRAFPENFRAYATACARGEVRPGRMFLFETGTPANPRYIVNFPTKRHWRARSRMEDIEAGLDALADLIRQRDICSVAVPPLGSGLGGLDWGNVRPRIEEALGGLQGVEVIAFEPHGAPVRSADEDQQRRARLLDEVTEDFKRRGIGLDMAENLPREKLNDRDRARAEVTEAANEPALVVEDSPEERERRRRKLNEAIEDIRANAPGFSARESLSREELYDRARARVGMAGYSPAGSSDET